MNEDNGVKEELNIPFVKKKEEPAAPVRAPKRSGFHIPAPAWFGIGCAVVIGGILAGLKIRDTVIGQKFALLDASQPVFAGYSGGGYLAEEFAPENNALRMLEDEIAKRREKGRSTDALEKLIASVSCGFEKEEGFSNNENLIYACSYDTDAAEQAGIRFDATMKTYTVSGLAEYAVLDVFDGVSADWQLDQSGLSIAVNAPQEYLDMGISYSYSYGGDSYNGESIDIHAEFDQNVLRSYGYVVETDEITWTLGPMPELITDLNTLSEDERAALMNTVQAMLENVIAGCGNRATLSALTGSYSIEITGISDAHIDESAMNYFNDSHRFRISFNLDTNSEAFISQYGNFSASYTGSIYRMSDGSIRFLTNTVHACEFTGFFGTYSLKESGE